MENWKARLHEVLRYSVVGISAFLVDSSVLVICKESFLRRYGAIGTMIGTLLGFTIGSVYNYSFSNRFVFRDARERIDARPVFSFSVFMAISLIGLGFTMAGMAAGIRLFGDRHYPLIKIAVAALVFVWNYTARKAILYRKKPHRFW